MSELAVVLIGLMITIIAGLFGQDYFKDREVKKLKEILEDK